MIMRDWTLLFSEYDLRAVLDAQLASVPNKVLEVDRVRFDRESDEQLSASIASALVVEPLELLEHDIEVSELDAKVDVSHDFNRGVRDRSVPAYVDGIEVTYHLPFTGDPVLLRCRPNRYTLNPPRATLWPRELRFPYDQPDRDVSATKRSFLRDLAALKEWVPWVNQQVAEYNSALEARVREAVLARRSALGRTRDDVAALGFRVRDSASTPSIQTLERIDADTGTRRAQSRALARKQYDVALSFAGEDREYVQRVADSLKELGVSVFYDGFEQVSLWGKDLAEHLGDVYGKDSRYVVLFLSRAYVAKAWPTHEKRFALARQLTDGRERILPVRFDNSEVPGIASTISFLDLRVLTPDKLAELIRQKVDALDA